MTATEQNITQDISTVGSISAVPLILETICRSTGMGFAVVARVTPEQWIACSVRDEIQFGLVPGGGLKVDTTICHEIRQSGNGVIIDHVQEDEVFYQHHTPAMYGFQSYISLPVVLENGSFFGTLCAIDPKPTLLNTPEVIGMFRSYSGLISFCMYADTRLSADAIQQMNRKIDEQLMQHLEQVVKNGTPDTRNVQQRELMLAFAGKVDAMVAEFRKSLTPALSEGEGGVA